MQKIRLPPIGRPKIPIIIRKPVKNSHMITELNIYLALFLAFILFTFSIRLGISLYQAM